MSETETQSVAPMRERIAEEIRALLGRRMLSASELARRIGATQPYISRRLTGDIAFDVDDLVKIAAVLGVEVADLFPREGRTVVFAGETRRQTTQPKSLLARKGRPNGHIRHSAPSPASRRLARISQVRH